jgi:hypothetical protein
MVRNRRPTTVDVPVLHVRTSLPHELKTQNLENATHLARLQNRKLCHGLPDLDHLSSNEFGLERRIPVFEQHADHLLQIPLQLIQ